jgi:hypothetical protein
MKQRLYAGHVTRAELMAMSRRFVGKLNARPVGRFGPGRLLWSSVEASISPSCSLADPLPDDQEIWDVTVRLTVVPDRFGLHPYHDGFGQLQYVDLYPDPENYAPHLAQLRDVTPSWWQNLREEASRWWVFYRLRLNRQRIKGDAPVRPPRPSGPFPPPPPKR